MEGYLYKFKPGLSSNFIKRYVQISQRAFRYFKSEAAAKHGLPLVSFRKRILRECVDYKVNKGSYIKSGSRIAHNKLENRLMNNMFEI